MITAGLLVFALVILLLVLLIYCTVAGSLYCPGETKQNLTSETDCLASVAKLDKSDDIKMDEREDMQEKTFRKWVNVHLARADQAPITDLFKDFREGVKLLVLLESLTGHKLPREKGKMRVHGINNINRALQFLQDQQVRLENVNASDLADGNPKITLGLLWHIVQHSWQILAEDEALDFRELALQDVLKRWCLFSTKQYDGVTVRNFTSSWQDGLAFNAIIHVYHPELFDFESVRAMEPTARLKHAFEVAHKNLNVQKLLDAEGRFGN